MEPSEVPCAVAAAKSAASSLGLRVDGAVVVNDGWRIAVRLVPCGVLARVAPLASRPESWAQFEVEIGRRLAGTDSPVGEPDPRVEPRVYVREDFAITLWTYYEPVVPSVIAPADYAHALVRLHAGLRKIDLVASDFTDRVAAAQAIVRHHAGVRLVDLVAPHFTDRVAAAQRMLGDQERTPELLGVDRDLLSATLSRLSAAIRDACGREQLLHGEPHPGNLLSTNTGPRFVDFETCCRGPVEFDLAHALLPAGVGGQVLAAEEISEHYPGANRDVVEQCRILVWAMVTTWRWRQDDQLPNGRYWRVEGLRQLRLALDR